MVAGEQLLLLFSALTIQPELADMCCGTPAGVPGPATNGSGGGAGGSTAEGARLRDAKVTHKVTTAEEYAEAKDAMVRLLYCLSSLACPGRCGSNQVLPA